MRYMGVRWDSQAESWDQFVDRVDRTRDSAAAADTDTQVPVDDYPLDNISEEAA